jgi:hypothetical protein
VVEAFGVELGSIAQVGTFLTIVIALIGAYVKLKDRGMTHAEVMCGQLTNEVANLRKELHQCETECREDIKRLHEELLGMRKQAVAEQLSFINILLSKVDAPELKILRETLERVQMSRVTVKILQQEEERTSGS